MGIEEMDVLEREIIDRFFRALDILVTSGEIKSQHAFLKSKTNLNNEVRLRKNNGGKFQASLLTFLVRDYNFSAEWLLTGIGAARKGITPDPF